MAFYISNSASCASRNDTSRNTNLCYVIAGRYQLLIGIDWIVGANSVYCKFLESTRAYIQSGDIVGQIPEVISINSTIIDTLVPNFCSYQTTLSASQGSDIDKSPKNPMSARTAVPIAIGLFAILVAAATIFVYTRYRTTSTDIDIDPNPSSTSDSDMEFQNSDETDEFEIDPTTTVDAGKHYQVTHSKHKRNNTPTATHNKNNNNTIRVAEVDDHGATSSPARTEQEIIFTPSSSVATSVLFRSP